MFLQEMMPLLTCPACRHPEMHLSDERLDCPKCKAHYPVHSGIPDLVPAPVADSSAWETWRHHLAGFQARVAARKNSPNSLIAKAGDSVPMHIEFAKFINVRGGNVLDVGCGPGKFRHDLKAPGVTYFGIDPIPLPEATQFRFIRGLAEFVPFKDGSFSHIVCLAAMDHFKDLPAFFAETKRLLKPGGRLHLLQSVHGVTGLSSAVKTLTHEIKDRLEDRATKSHAADAPKHMTEFSESTLMETLGRHFEIESRKEYSQTWYTPSKLFLTLKAA